MNLGWTIFSLMAASRVTCQTDRPQADDPKAPNVSDIYQKVPFTGNIVTRRKYPFCVGEEVLQEYKSELGEGEKLAGDMLHFRNSALESIPIMVTGTPSEGDRANVEEIKYSIISNYAPQRETRYRNIGTINQWIHITIYTKYPTNVLIVQANVLPYAMPYGNFDIEFACKDCYADKSQVSDFATSDQLGFSGKAAVLPCARRTHMHVRHPNIYIYASRNSRKEFHLNYNYFDVTCRETKQIQFMIAYKYAFKVGAFYTAVIDHESIHQSFDGMPYPVHGEIVQHLRCHDRDDGIIFVSPDGGHSAIELYEPYEKCLLTSETDNYKSYIEKEMYQSDWVCNNIPRTRCPYDESTAIVECAGFDRDKNKFEQCGKSGKVCGRCTVYNNKWMNEIYKRLIRRTYASRMAHGMLMIFSMIALSNISIHITRYFKETGGGCLMVGCWLWGHLACSIASVLCLWAGVAIVYAMPQRGYHATPTFSDVIGRHYQEQRDIWILTHYIVGGIAFLIFHFTVLFGAWRPFRGRYCWIFSHAFVGYLTVVLGTISTWVSTACWETRLWTTLMMLIAIFPWTAGFALQREMDGRQMIRRKYFPVIEAIKVSKYMPMKEVRAALFGFLTFLTYIFIVITTVKSNYIGLLVYNPCKNCQWKYDEVILEAKDNALSSHSFMKSKYQCQDSDLSVFGIR